MTFTSLSGLGAAPSPGEPLTAQQKALEDAHRDAMQGLCCVLGRLQAIPTHDALDTLGSANDLEDVDAGGARPQPTSRGDILRARVSMLIGFLHGVTEEWAREEALAELAYQDAAIEEALTSYKARAAADEIAWSHESYYD